MADTLLSSACQRIRFDFAGVAVRPGGYTVIAFSLIGPRPNRRLAANRRPMDVRVESLSAGTEAAYRALNNEIVVPSVTFGATLQEERSIVHEATHAVFDFQRTRITALDEEAAAFLAGAIFWRLSGGGPVATSITGPALEIAGDLVSRHPALVPWTYTVTPQQQDRLVTAVRASYPNLRRRPRSYRYTHSGGGL
jgi:hypothetical protein